MQMKKELPFSRCGKSCLLRVRYVSFSPAGGRGRGQKNSKKRTGWHVEKLGQERETKKWGKKKILTLGEGYFLSLSLLHELS